MVTYEPFVDAETLFAWTHVDVDVLFIERAGFTLILI